MAIQTNWTHRTGILWTSGWKNAMKASVTSQAPSTSVK